ERVRSNHLPGAAVIVVRDDVELHRAYYGSFDGSTVVAIASTSKWLTSATLLTLVDDGALHLDDPVGTYLPAWNRDHAPDKAAITVRQLLSHQAGLPGSAACLGDASLSLDDCAPELAGLPLVAAPGTAFHSGNAGATRA